MRGHLFEPRSHRALLAALLAGLAALVASCAARPTKVEVGAFVDGSPANPAAIRAALERDRARLLDWIATPRSAAELARALQEDTELREIAARMPALQAALVRAEAKTETAPAAAQASEE